MIQLRPYQIHLVEEIIQSINSGYRKILTVLPMGGGKSVIIGGVLNNLTLSNHFTNNVVVTPFSKLKIQLAKTLQGMGAVARSTTYHSAAQQLADIDVLILDEAHHIMGNEWRKIPDRLVSSVTCGFTATPYRADDCPLLEENGGYFDKLIVGPDLQTLTKDGFLANLEYYSYPLIKKVEKTPMWLDKEYVGESTYEYYEAENKEKEIVEEYVRNFKDMSTVVFCRTVEHAKFICKQFRDKGIRAETINCYQSKSLSDEIIGDFKRNVFPILATCNLGSEGLDIPNAKLGMMARPIKKSTALFLQQAGRVIRPYNNETAKILDLVGNIYTFGAPQEAAQKEIR